MKKIYNELHITNLYSFRDRHFSSNKVFIGHKHPFWEINYIVNGTMQMTYEENVIVLKPGDLLIAEPHSFHKYIVLNNKSIDFLGIEFYSNSIEQLGVPRVYQLNSEQKSLFDILVNQIRTFEKNTSPILSTKNYPYILHSLLSSFLLLILDNEAISNNVLSEETLLYNKIYTYMIRNVARNLRIEDISKHFNVCSTTIKNTFKKYTGSSIARAFTELKIDKAKQLLLLGNSVTDVADVLSFSTQAYFSNVFKKVTNLTPTEFIKQSEENKIVQKNPLSH